MGSPNEIIADMKAKPVSEANLEARFDIDLTASESELLTPKQNKGLRVKADLVVLPIMVVASTLAFLDKVNFPIPRILPRI